MMVMGRQALDAFEMFWHDAGAGLAEGLRGCGTNYLRLAVVGLLAVAASIFLAYNAPPVTAETATVVAAGTHTCALTTAGGVKCWGDNGWGQTNVPGANTGFVVEDFAQIVRHAKTSGLRLNNIEAQM